MEENLEEFVLKNVKMSFMSVKEDRYDNTNSYFRIVHKTFNDRVKPIVKDGYKQAWFFNNGKPLKQILKVKQKDIKSLSDELNKDEKYSFEITFKYYNVDGNEGYYVSKLVLIL